MKKITQFVFYGPNDERNRPANSDDWKYNLFKKYHNVSHLGIQGASGTLFCLNGGSTQDAISIGSTGVYEIDLTGIGTISSLRFVWDKLIQNYPYDPNSQRHVIVDIVYGGES